MFSIEQIPLGESLHDKSCVVCRNWPWHTHYFVLAVGDVL